MTSTLPDTRRPEDAPESAQTVVTPTVGGFFRRIRFWIGIAVVLLVIAIGYTLLAPPSLTDRPLDSTGTGQTGARALAQVLRDHGVTVTATTSLPATRAAIAGRSDTTVFVYDPDHYLDSVQLRALPSLSRDVVVMSPSASDVRALDPAITLIGTSKAAPTADCSLAAARRAGTIADGGEAYRVTASATGYTRCYPSGDNDYSLVQHRDGASTLTVVGATTAFDNAHIADSGNAALALNLLGAHQHLVWYLPSIDDVGAGGKTESLAEAAPHWFGAFSILVLFVIVAAAAWRGRRFGPLAIEQLPVIVRSSETMEGRARLYQASSARLRALDSLRIGAITRIGRSCGLPRTADVETIAGAASAITGRPLTEVREVLLGGVPTSDSDLVRRSDQLVELEADVTKATGATPSSQRPSDDPDRGKRE